MDGLLIVDKPSGPTSHDVVARVRRAIRERRIGHTGTLDPMASGVLPLVVGRATRLARFLSAGDKTYDATIELGLATDSHDALGRPVGPRFEGPFPAGAEIDAALDRFRGTFLQQPPAFSAKKIDGRRSYAIARQGSPGVRSVGSLDPTIPVESLDPTIPATLPEPVHVTAHAIDLVDVSGSRVMLRVRCSAGFYVRSLAHDLGQSLGVGAHLAALRRIEAAGARIEDAVPLDAIEARGLDAAAAALIPMERMVPAMPALALTGDGVVHARSGRDLGPADAALGFPDGWLAAGRPLHVRLLDEGGRLVGLAEPAASPGFLHPAVILM